MKTINTHVGETFGRLRILARIVGTKHKPARFFVRCAEAVGLKIGQISDDGLWFRYVLGKGKKRRHVPITPELAPELQTFLAYRETLPMGKEQPLIPSPFERTERTVRHLGNKTVWQILKDVGNTNPHSCRHTFGYQTMARLLKQFDKSGLSPSQALDRALRVTAKIMGHSNTKTTMRYLQVQKSHMDEAFHEGFV